MKKRILVVENDREILNVISYILKDEGYNVKSIQSLKGIIELIHTYKPDVILLDIIIPEVESSEICKTIKSTDGIKHIPVIVLSTHPKVTASIKEICADDVISKPFDINNLVQVINDKLVV